MRVNWLFAVRFQTATGCARVSPLRTPSPGSTGARRRTRRLLPGGLAGGCLHGPSPRGHGALRCQRPRLAPHDVNAHQPEQELAELAACSREGLRGACRGGTRSCRAWLPAAGSERPLQTASSGASTSVRLSQLRLPIAKGSFTRTARNRKFNCPQHDLFYSYSGKYNCGSQHLQQLRTGIIRSARPPGPVHHHPAPQSATKGNAGSARVRLRFCRRGCRLQVLLPFHPPLPCAGQPCPCPSCSTSPEPAFWQNAPGGWLWQLSPLRVGGGGGLPDRPSDEGTNARPPRTTAAAVIETERL